MDERDQREERTEASIRIRRVSHLRAAWTEGERGAAGAFTLQLILDDGADEYVLRPTAEDADVLLALWARSGGATFDLDRKVLIYDGLGAK